MMMKKLVYAAVYDVVRSFLVTPEFAAAMKGSEYEAAVSEAAGNKPYVDRSAGYDVFFPAAAPAVA